MKFNKLKLIAIASTILLSGCASINFVSAESTNEDLNYYINSLCGQANYTRETTFYFSETGWEYVKEHNRFIDGFSRDNRTTIFAHNSLYMYSVDDKSINSGYYSSGSISDGLYHFTLKGGVISKDEKNGSLIENIRVDSIKTNVNLFFPIFNILDTISTSQTNTVFASLFTEGSSSMDYYVWTSDEFDTDVATSQDLKGQMVDYTLEDFVEGFVASCYSCTDPNDATKKYISYDHVEIKVDRNHNYLLMELYAADEDKDKVSGDNNLFASAKIDFASFATSTINILDFWPNII